MSTLVPMVFDSYTNAGRSPVQCGYTARTMEVAPGSNPAGSRTLVLEIAQRAEANHRAHHSMLLEAVHQPIDGLRCAQRNALAGTDRGLAAARHAETHDLARDGVETTGFAVVLDEIPGAVIVGVEAAIESLAADPQV